MNDAATPPPPIPPADLRVWWLTESDYCGFEPHQEVNPLCIPDYAWEQFCDRYGRAGWGRLWVPDHIQLAGLPIASDDPRWPSFSNAGGIVIESRHAAACARWGGTITTLTLDPVTVEDAAETGMEIISSGANGLSPDGACSALKRLRTDVRTGRLPAGVEADVKTILELAEIGISWRADSSIEKWFPFSAKRLAELEAKVLQNSQDRASGSA